MASSSDSLHTSEAINRLTEAIRELTQSHEYLRREVTESNIKSSMIVENLERQETRIETIEEAIKGIRSQEKSKSLIIFKLTDGNERKEILIEKIFKLFEEIGVSIPSTAIVDAFRLGKNIGNRPLLVEFIASRWTKMVFEKRSALNNIGLSIANNRSKEERDERKKLITGVHTLKELGKNIKLNYNNKIILDNKIITTEEMNLLLANNDVAHDRSTGEENSSTSKTIIENLHKPDPRTRTSKRIQQGKITPLNKMENKMDKYFKPTNSSTPRTRSNSTVST